jgi:DNA polymerase-3 subunit delta
MSALNRPQLERSLKEGNVRPLYLLIGVESYLRDQAARAIADEALRETLLREFNESRFSLASGNVHEAIAAAEQLPMMSAKRVVRITDFGKLREAEEEVLIRYLKRPVESSVVIFVGEDLDKRKKLTKELLDKCAVVEFPAVKDGEARAWAKEHLRRLKVSADERVLGEIITLVGADIQTLSSELEKLASAAAETGRVTSEMVDDLIGRSRELSNFALGDQLIARNRKRAMETLHRLLEDGAEPVMLIGLLAGNYHRLAIAKDLLTRGKRDEIFRVVRMPPFRQQEFVDTLQRSDASTIARGIERIAAADLAIKTSLGTPRLQLEMLVLELAGNK